MSAFIDKLRYEVGNGDWESEDAHNVAIGLPHPLWQEMCDVVDAAAKMEWRIHRGLPLWSARRRLNSALDRLREGVA